MKRPRDPSGKDQEAALTSFVESPEDAQDRPADLSRLFEARSTYKVGVGGRGHLHSL